MNRLKLGVVGAGHLGRIHARLLAEMSDVELVAVADPVAAARDKVAADHGAAGVADHRELVGHVDAAVIATPTRLHHAVALDFLRSGTPLLVEKPLAATVAEADQLLDAARRHGAILQVGHIERFNPAFTAAAARVGRPQYVDAVRASGFTGRSTDIGVVHDLMIHDVDLVLSLIDAPLVRVDAVGVAILGQQEDAAQARLEFADGCVANLSASRASYSAAPHRRMHLWSARGFAAIDFGTCTASVVTPSEAVKSGEFDYESLSAEEKAGFKDRLFTEILRVEPLQVESRNALADELRDFVDAVRNRTEPRVTGREGRDALAVVEAIVNSIRAHRWQIHEPAPPAPILRGPHWKPALPTRPIHREAG
ncbi:MAG: Gfo/Idh/MocA family oxidoreductase [Pirellulales bacterium]